MSKKQNYYKQTITSMVKEENTYWNPRENKRFHYKQLLRSYSVNDKARYPLQLYIHDVEEWLETEYKDEGFYKNWYPMYM